MDEEQKIEATDEFIRKNNLTLDRSQKEILGQMESTEKSFHAIFFKQILIDYLEQKHGIDLVTEDYKKKILSGKEKWEQITDLKKALQEFLDYMVFAWGKALNMRGLSSSRSLSKLSSWLWLFGREDLQEIAMSDDLYNPYGAPALIKVCEELGIEVPDDLREFAKKKVTP